jgi:hypothetical protein
MAKWAYKRVTFDVLDVLEDGFEAELDKVGQEGWELIATFDRERGGNSKECFFLFKRMTEA